MTRRRIFREEKKTFLTYDLTYMDIFLSGVSLKVQNVFLTSGFERSDCKYIFDLKTTVQ